MGKKIILIERKYGVLTEHGILVKDALFKSLYSISRKVISRSRIIMQKLILRNKSKNPMCSFVNNLEIYCVLRFFLLASPLLSADRYHMITRLMSLLYE